MNKALCYSIILCITSVYPMAMAPGIDTGAEDRRTLYGTVHCALLSVIL